MIEHAKHTLINLTSVCVERGGECCAGGRTLGIAQKI
jgi:hypothetical protein